MRRKPLAILILVVTVMAITTLTYFIYTNYLTPISSERVCERFFNLSQQEFEKELGTDLSDAEIQNLLGINPQTCVQEENKRRNESKLNPYELTKISKCQEQAKDAQVFLACED